MRCPEVCDVNGKQVRCMVAGTASGRPHFAHRWTSPLKSGGGRMEIHWRSIPVSKNAGQMKNGVCREGLHRWSKSTVGTCERCGTERREAT